MSSSAHPCQKINLPFDFRKSDRSVLAVPMTASYWSTDWSNNCSKRSAVSVVKSHDGSCKRKYRNHSSAIRNGCPVGGEPVVPARRVNGVPRGSPYQSQVPSARRGPSHTFWITLASADVNSPQLS